MSNYFKIKKKPLSPREMTNTKYRMTKQKHTDRFYILQLKSPDFISRSDYQFTRLTGYKLSGINSIKHWWHLILRIFLSPISLKYHQRLEMWYLPDQYTKSYQEEPKCDLLMESTSHSQLLKREMRINPKCLVIAYTYSVICSPPPCFGLNGWCFTRC